MAAHYAPGSREAWHALLAALSAAAYVFVIDLLAGLVANGIDLEHLGNLKHAGLAAIAAALAGLGVGGGYHLVTSNNQPKGRTMTDTTSTPEPDDGDQTVVERTEEKVEEKLGYPRKNPPADNTPTDEGDEQESDPGNASSSQSDSSSS